MGRMVRKVPANWEHPREPDGSYKPMYDRTYKDAANEWMSECMLWCNMEHPGQAKAWGKDCAYYWEYAGMPPKDECYRPEWKEEERTHYMMYEDTSEGTPISPAFSTPEELAHWLTDTGASAFGDMTASYDQWLIICRGKWAPGIVIKNGIMKSGVEVAQEPTQIKD